MTALEYLRSLKAQKGDILIRFGCSIRLPKDGHFYFKEDFTADAETFLRHWIEASLTNIYRAPLTNRKDPHDGHLLDVPKVAVKYLPNYGHKTQ